jgi:hypothetical protein
MRNAIIFGISVFLTIGICAAEIPDLLGNWTGSAIGYVADDGSYNLSENNISFTIIEQNERLFAGNLTYTLNGKDIVEAFAGAIGLDNKTLYIAEFNEGYDQGTIISNDEIELIYLADGKMGRAFIDTLHRVSNVTKNVTTNTTDTTTGMTNATNPFERAKGSLVVVGLGDSSNQSPGPQDSVGISSGDSIGPGSSDISQGVESGWDSNIS